MGRGTSLKTATSAKLTTTVSHCVSTLDVMLDAIFLSMCVCVSVRALFALVYARLCACARSSMCLCLSACVCVRAHVVNIKTCPSQELTVCLVHPHDALAASRRLVGQWNVPFVPAIQPLWLQIFSPSVAPDLLCSERSNTKKHKSSKLTAWILGDVPSSCIGPVFGGRLRRVVLGVGEESRLRRAELVVGGEAQGDDREPHLVEPGPHHLRDVQGVADLLESARDK